MAPREVEQKLIVVVDDDRTVLRSCQRVLSTAGYEVETHGEGMTALKCLEDLRPGVMLVDLKMPGISGQEVIERARTIDPDMVIVVITGYGTVGSAVKAMKAGAYDFVTKPFTPDELRAVVDRAAERSRLTLEANRLREEKEQAHRLFVTFVTHQLKSPLAAVIQYLDALADLMRRDPKPEYQPWLTWIHR